MDSKEREIESFTDRIQEKNSPLDIAAESGGYYTTDGENGRALRLYMDRLAAAVPLEPEAENQLWEKISVLHAEIRTLLSFFGTTYIHAIALLEKVTAVEDLYDLFPQSFLADAENMKKIFAELPELRLKLTQIHENLFGLNASGNKKKKAQLRNEGALLLNNYPFLLEFILTEINLLRQKRIILESGNEQAIQTMLGTELLCSKEEFIEHDDKLEKSMERMDLERNHLVESYLRLVVSIAKHYHSRNVPMIDLIQEGNVGLLKAIDKFDYRLGHRFSTYASWWIKQNICHAVSRQSRIIRLPIHMMSALNQISKAEQQFLQEKGREAAPEEIAERLGMPRERVNSLKKMAMQSISLQASVYTHDNTGKEVLVEDTINDYHDENDPMRSLAKKILAHKLQEILDTLPARTREILACRFGLDGEKPMSLHEMSRHFKVSRERIRQIENNALAKMRSPDTISKLEDYFL